MGYLEHREKSPKSLNFAVLTISDTRTEESDESGRIIIGGLRKYGHRISFYSIIKDDFNLIQKTIKKLLKDSKIQVIITNGGTGISKRDVTIDVVLKILEKKLDGFGELFRYLSYDEIGSSAIMSRTVAGIADGKIIICIPGSKDAVKLAMDELILPEIGHMVYEVGK